MELNELGRIADQDQQTTEAMRSMSQFAAMLGRFRADLITQGFTRAEAMELVSTYLSTTLYIGSGATKDALRIERGDGDDRNF